MASRATTVDEVLKKYRLGPVLGRGQFGVVQRAEVISSGELVAVKIIEKGRMEPEKLQLEIACHSMLEHRHVLKFIEAIDLDDCVVMVVEFAGGGDLFDYIVQHGKVTEEAARPLFRQLLEALCHCHSRHVAHRDLKPENIMLSEDGELKLADFGLSVQFQPDTPLTDSVGSPNYAAPELLVRGCSYDGRKIDAWACGVVLFAMLAGRLPFDRDAIPDLFRDIKRGIYEIPGFFSAEVADLIKRLLTKNPAERFSVEDALGHAWFSAAGRGATSTAAAAEVEAAAVGKPQHLDPSATLPLLPLDELEEEGEAEGQDEDKAAEGERGKSEPEHPLPVSPKPVKERVVLTTAGSVATLSSHDTSRALRWRASLRRRVWSALGPQRCRGGPPSGLPPWAASAPAVAA